MRVRAFGGYRAPSSPCKRRVCGHATLRTRCVVGPEGLEPPLHRVKAGCATVTLRALLRSGAFVWSASSCLSLRAWCWIRTSDRTEPRRLQRRPLDHSGNQTHGVGQPVAIPLVQFIGAHDVPLRALKRLKAAGRVFLRAAFDCDLSLVYWPPYVPTPGLRLICVVIAGTQ